MPANTNHY